MKIAMILIPIIAFVSGSIFKHHDKFEDVVDHPAEEFTEAVLDEFGYEVDFSAEKKAEQREQEHKDESQNHNNKRN